MVLWMRAIAARRLILAISPRPKISGVRSRTRKAESATLLTGSPYKNELEDKLKVAEARSSAIAFKAAAKSAALIKSLESTKQRKRSSNDDPQPSTSTTGRKKRAKLLPKTKTAAVRSKKRKATHDDTSSEDEEWPCLICGEPFANSMSREKWVQCQQCAKWAHEACTDGYSYFTCPNCESD